MGVSVAAASAGLAGDGYRESLDLNGEWETQKVADLDGEPAPDSWKAFQVPGTLWGTNYERAWFRRQFTLPPAMRGKRIKIRFDGVKFNSRILVNGVRVGGCLNGHDAFEVDATGAVRFDAPNTLLVGCHDWTGVFSEGHYDMSEKPDWERARRFVKDKVIAPIGGHCDLYGIWGDVTLEAVPEVYVRDLFIKTSVRKGELEIEYTLANESGRAAETEISAVVEEKGKTVLQLPAQKVSVPAGGTGTVTLRKKWTDYRPWSHEDPWLYQLRTTLEGCDGLTTRFGFREFWIEGHRYVLNGSKINLLASSWWPPQKPMEREEIRKTWLTLKAAGVTCFRTHTQPWRRIHYEVADEVGLLMIPEGPVWHDPYCTAYDNPVFWDNYVDSVEAMIRREKNRPSVIMWSLGNEIYGGGKAELAEKGLARVGRAARAADPTRPIYFESDGDPEGVADAIGLHYIHEYPKFTCWPNEAYWLEKPFSPPTWQMVKEPARWNREKPLYIGEFLWVPSGTPEPHTVFYGDEAYRDLDLYTRRGKGEAWKMQIIAFRWLEAGGISPWTVSEGGELDETNPLYRAHQYAYQPVAAYCLDYDSRFFSGEQVERRVAVFNDTLAPAELELSWQLLRGNEAVDRGGETIALEPGEKRLAPVTLRMPETGRRTPLVWRVVVKRNGREEFEEDHQYAVFPPFRLQTPGVKIGLLDRENGPTGDLLAGAGVPFQRVDALDHLGSDVEILILGAGALHESGKASPVIGSIDPRRAALVQFAERGGRVLVLRQERYPEGLFGLDLTEHQSTMTFPLRSRHPALAGIEEDDLKFWRGDHLVTAAEAPRPDSGASVPIIVSGSAGGIEHAPLLERPAGRGSIVHCQLRLVEKAHTEPAAGMLLDNLLRYLGNGRAAIPQTVLLGGDDGYRAALRDLGLRFESPVQPSDGVVLSGRGLVICRGEVPDLDRWGEPLREHVSAGGNLLVHRPSAATMKDICRALKISLEMRPRPGTVQPAEDAAHFLADAICREDLYWSLKMPGSSWQKLPLSREMIDGVFSPRFEAGNARACDLDSWETGGGPFVHRREDGILFASAGTASGEVDFSETGLYGLGVRAKGTPCQGEYPIVEFSIDGHPVGTVSLDGPEWKDYGLFTRVERGSHTVSVAFINDASNPPREDRNLEIAKVYAEEKPRQSDLVYLTQPAALAAHPVGRGTVVFDGVRWDTEETNRKKASRHAISLLTSLNADFTPRQGVTIRCEAMKPNPEMKHFSATEGTATLNANGYVASEIEVAESGRYTAELVASGNPCDGEYAIAELRLDGVLAGKAQLTSGNPRSYPLDLSLEKGAREIRIQFVNDRSSPEGGDRSLNLHTITFYRSGDR